MNKTTREVLERQLAVMEDAVQHDGERIQKTKETLERQEALRARDEHAVRELKASLQEEGAV